MTGSIMDDAKSVDEISRKLANNLAYLHLMCALVPGELNISHPAMNEVFQDVNEFYQNASKKDILTKGPKITKTFES